MNKNEIGIFDSGIGGITILNELKKYYLMKILYIMQTQKIIHTETNL